ncbi:MAG TPA: TetR/AcrR family transcriptional regulator [Solirubrobacterales bacterium]|nr:TetR/AcrR family transcriptional regulator [Solirubrobacterales bacterium]
MAKNQRERLFAAMVACVATSGYEATRVADLVDVSGVSSRSFYDLFPNKEACFAAMLEELLGATVATLTKAENPNASWQERLRQTYDAFAAILAAQPASATICLSEAYGAGPTARKPLDEAVAGLEQLTRRRLAESPERVGMPEEMIVAHVGALQEMARTRLREGEPGELAALVPQLVDLMVSYRPPPKPLRLATRAPTFGPESIAAHDDAERALRAFAAAVTELGYGGVTIHEVAKRGAMSPSTFYANFRDKQDAMLAAIDSAMAQLATAATTAFQRGPGWAAGIRAAIGSMLNFLASRPAMAHLLAVDVFAAGAGAIGRRAKAVRPLAVLLAEGHRQAPDTPSIAGEVIAGGIAALVRRRILESGPGALPALAPICTYIALAPFIGAERACAAANGDGRARMSAGFERAPREPNAQPTRWSVLMQAILAPRPADAAAIAAELGIPASDTTQFLEELEAEGLVERVPPRRPGGAPHWIYRETFRLIEKEEWASMTAEERAEASAEIVGLMMNEAAETIAKGSFNRRLDSHASRVGFTIDEQGWRELVEIHRSTLLATRAVELSSLRRLKESGHPGITGRSMQLLFEMPEPDDAS